MFKHMQTNPCLFATQIACAQFRPESQTLTVLWKWRSRYSLALIFAKGSDRIVDDAMPEIAKQSFCYGAVRFSPPQLAGVVQS